jgi:hypothetical protein
MFTRVSIPLGILGAGERDEDEGDVRAESIFDVLLQVIGKLRRRVVAREGPHVFLLQLQLLVGSVLRKVNKENEA